MRAASWAWQRAWPRRCTPRTANLTFLVNDASSTARSLGRCRWPLTRQELVIGLEHPAAHQRSGMVPSRQCFEAPGVLLAELDQGLDRYLQPQLTCP